MSASSSSSSTATKTAPSSSRAPRALSRVATSDAPEVSRLAGNMIVASDSMAEAESVTLGLWVRVGAGHEREHENGLAHLLEHMVFKGTRRYSAREIVERIESVGGWINAATGRESTSYECKVPPGELRRAVGLLGELFCAARLAADDLESEREVVLQELGQAEDTPDDIIFDRFQAAAWPGHPMGRSILGTPDSLRGFTVGSLREFRARHYRPPRVIWTAAGRLEHGDFLDAIGEGFAARDGGDGVSTRLRGAPRYSGGFTGEDRALSQLHIVFGTRGLGRLDDSWPALALLSQILGGGMSSRLFQDLREEAGLAYAVHSFLTSLKREGLFGVYAGCEPSRGEELVRRLVGGLREVAGRAPDADECECARAQLRSSVLFSRERSEARMESLARRLFIYGRARPLVELLSALDAVTPEEVRDVAGRLLSESPRLVVLGPLCGGLDERLRAAAEIN
ncbi:MAG: insulinase family protein [Alphaproteobacteria bacterium]|nr:insulinase family protein [Alphaproteobacteria bacterium]MDA8004502.1 insulinase family protein [Alphaproteobacteria bacterium]MDA8006423.1 insulinase family protein [Alphaproteobacteria bacterium]MDA8013822.1 insulinase family protein [Alphaproteobacteria bacterium]